MDFLQRIRKLENLHIVFWLIKDTCWMMEFKLPGVMMILPALIMAMVIVFQTRHTADVYINLAIFCWISANSYWMFVEFYFNNQGKQLALLPFALGFVFVAFFYARSKKAVQQKA